MEYYKQPYAKKSNSLHEMDKFPERYKLLKTDRRNGIYPHLLKKLNS